MRTLPSEGINSLLKERISFLSQVVLRFELRALSLLGSSSPFFALVIFGQVLVFLPGIFLGL
jgi:hypothetical protein